MHSAAFLLTLTYPAMLALAAAGDIARYSIANRLCIALALLYLPAALVAGTPLATVAWHAGAGAAVLAICAAAFFARLMGGGDAKLLAACACWTGFQALPALFLYVALAGGALALVLLVVRTALRRLRPIRVDEEGSQLAHLLARPRDVPYGLAIAIGGLVSFPASIWSAWCSREAEPLDIVLSRAFCCICITKSGPQSYAVDVFRTAV